MWSIEDKNFMRMALRLAENGRGHVNPNPLVGAVIVKDGQPVAEGWHKRYGGLHAETDALASCSTDPAGATMYVTLEPCCHFGKQPPCTSAIINAGISRVVVAMKDPNPLVAGHGVEILRENGIEVCTGLLEEEARYLNRVFIKYITTRRPWVTAKYAMTLDGRIASYSGDSRWVSCAESRDLVHRMRGGHTGIAAGIGTVLADDPMLNCRAAGMRQPVRIIVDSRASMPETSAVARTAGEYPAVLAHTPDADRGRLAALEGLGVRTLECGADRTGMVDLHDMLQKLGEMQIDSVLLEGGAELDWSMVSGGLVDEFYIFIAPKIIGGRSAKGPVGGTGFSMMADAIQLEVESAVPCGEDILVHAFPGGAGWLRDNGDGRRNSARTASGKEEYRCLQE